MSSPRVATDLDPRRGWFTKESHLPDERWHGDARTELTSQVLSRVGALCRAGLSSGIIRIPRMVHSGELQFPGWSLERVVMGVEEE